MLESGVALVVHPSVRPSVRPPVVVQDQLSCRGASIAVSICTVRRNVFGEAPKPRPESQQSLLRNLGWRIFRLRQARQRREVLREGV